MPCRRLYIIRILFYPEVVRNTSDTLTGKIGNIVEGDDDRQLFLNAHCFSIAVLHDFQFSINWVDHNNCAGQTKAEADKQVAITKAEAEAQKTSIAADAQAEANRKIAESLSDSLIEYQKIQKWDGRLPTVSGGNALVSIDPAE